MAFKIDAQTIKPGEQRFSTVGDYWEVGDSLKVRVSDMGDFFCESLVLVHELVEYILLRKAGISETEVLGFDLLFEEEVKRGLHAPEDEPGDDPRAPYHRQHEIATLIERMLCLFLGIEWDTYEAKANQAWRGK